MKVNTFSKSKQLTKTAIDMYQYLVLADTEELCNMIPVNKSMLDRYLLITKMNLRHHQHILEEGLQVNVKP